MDISTRLDEAMRLRENISQSALSRLSGVPQPTINRILKGGGAKGPETATVTKLADALNVRFEWLMEGRGPMARPSAGAGPDRAPGWSELTRVDAYELRILGLIRQLDERGKGEAENGLSQLVESTRKLADDAPESTTDRGSILRITKG